MDIINQNCSKRECALGRRHSYVCRALAVALSAILLFVAAPVVDANLSSVVDTEFSNADLDGPAATVNVEYCGGIGLSSCPDTTADSRVTWGSGGRSSLGFDETNLSSIVLPASNSKVFNIGTLTHTNEQINFFSAINGVDFTLSVQVTDTARSVTLSASGVANLEILETSNIDATCQFAGTPPNCFDRLRLVPPFLVDNVDDGNVRYRLDGVQFDSGSTVFTEEFMSTSIPMRARITRISLVDADAGPDQTVDEATTVNLDGTGSKVTGLSYSWNQVSGPSVTLLGANTATPTFFAPELTSTDQVVFELTVQDLKEPNNPDLRDSDRVRVTIIDVNDPPVADPGDSYVVDEGSSIALDGSGSTDPDGQPLTYSWDFDVDGTIDATGLTPVFDAALRDGPLTVPVQLEVCDTFGVCDQASTVVEVRNVAPSPVVRAPNVVDEGSPITLLATATDPAPADEAILSYAWDLDGGGTFDDHFGPSPSLTPPDGPLVIPVSVEVCDDDGGCTIAAGTVDVLNVPPAVDIGPDLIFYRNDVVDITGIFADPAGSFDDPYTFDWTGDAPFVFSAGNVTFGDPIPVSTTYPIEGFYGVALAVTDKDGDTGTDELVVEVLNRPPECTDAGPSIPELWPPNHKYRTVAVEGLTDPEGDTLTTTITSIFQDEPVDALGSGPTSTVDARGVGTSVAELKAERAGPQDSRFYHVAFLVDDGHGGQCTGTIRVVVPHDQGANAVLVDGGPLYDSTIPA